MALEGPAEPLIVDVSPGVQQPQQTSLNSIIDDDGPQAAEAAGDGSAGSGSLADSTQEVADRILMSGIRISPTVIGMTSERMLDHYQFLGRFQ